MAEQCTKKCIYDSKTFNTLNCALIPAGSKCLMPICIKENNSYCKCSKELGKSRLDASFAYLKNM